MAYCMLPLYGPSPLLKLNDSMMPEAAEKYCKQDRGATAKSFVVQSICVTRMYQAAGGSCGFNKRFAVVNDNVIIRSLGNGI